LVSLLTRVLLLRPLLLLLQVAVPQRLQAFASVLAASLSSPDGQALPAHSPLPRLAVTFVTANLKVCYILEQCQPVCSAEVFVYVCALTDGMWLTRVTADCYYLWYAQLLVQLVHLLL
jgi:hypothetical protein